MFGNNFVQTMGYCLRLLNLQAAKNSTNTEATDPSMPEYRKGEIFVAEAIGVICNSDGTARLPGAYMGAVTWQAVQSYIRTPATIVAELRYVALLRMRW